MNLDVKFMNQPKVAITDQIGQFIDYCMDQGADESFSNLLTNQSLCSFVQFGIFSVYGEIYGFSCGLTKLGRENYDLILNYTFMHVNTVKKNCLTNSSMYDAFYASYFNMSYSYPVRLKAYDDTLCIR